MQNNIKVDTKTIKYDINSGFLRLFAAFLIIMSALSWDVINLPAQTRESFEAMKPLTFFALFGHIGIPLFIMISGAFFLDPDKNISTESMFKKYIPKAIWVFFCWSFFYALLEQSFFSGVKAQGPIGAWHLLDMERLLKSVLLGHSHLWYMYTLIGLYLITPLLRIFTQNAKKILVDYFAFLCVFITSVVTLNAGVLHNEFLEQVVVKSNIFLPTGFLGYYLLGYAIKKSERKKLFSVMFALLSALTLYYSLAWNMDLNPIGTRAPINLALISYFSPAIYLLSITIFMGASAIPKTDLSSNKQELIKDIAKYTGTIYMIFPFVIEMCEKTNTISPIHQWQTLLVNNMIIFFIALILAALLNLPLKGIRKWFSKV